MGRSFKRKNKKVDMPAQVIDRVKALFSEKNWEISEDDELDLFERFCARLSFLENNEKELMIELAKNFYRFPAGEYLALFDRIIKKISSVEEIRAINTILLAPLLAPNDIGKAKSSIFLFYLVKSSYLPYSQFFRKRKVKEHDNLESISQEKIRGDAFVLLVDDFVGSGKTAEKAILELNRIGISNDKIIIISLVAQKDGIDKMHEMGVKIYTDQIIKRGISDSYEGDLLAQYTQLMSSIEQKMRVGSNYFFGYNRSEALVSMARTPNNTFPLFWYEDKHLTLAPFPRFSANG